MLGEEQTRTRKVSPIAWDNTNLGGRYEFQKQPDPLNIDAIIRETTETPLLIQMLFWQARCWLYHSGAIGKEPHLGEDVLTLGPGHDADVGDRLLRGLLGLVGQQVCL